MTNFKPQHILTKKKIFSMKMFGEHTQHTCSDSASRKWIQPRNTERVFECT